MGERGVGNPWTTFEDSLLIQAVAIHGENDNWKAVACLVPGRTNKACRKRWLHSLSPNVKKTAWTHEEDRLLLTLYAAHGTKWSVIARNIPGRTDDACSKRYREALDPALKHDDWTADEDARLHDAYARLGGKWGIIGQELSRSGLGCRNRWRMLERRRAAQTRDTAARGEPSSSSSAVAQWTPSHAHVGEPPRWDGQSPQYVAPSELHQGSPVHIQEPRVTSYSPEQILSGAHLGGSPYDPQDPSPFQYTSSSLYVALSHPGSVAPSPAHGSDVRASAPATYSYTEPEPEPDLGHDDHAHDHTAAPTYPFERSHPMQLSPDISTVHEFTERTSLADVAGPLIISDSPASPSQASSSPPPGSPLSPSGNHTANSIFTSSSTFTSASPPAPAPAAGPADTPADPIVRSHYRTDAEKVPRTAPARKPRDTVAPIRLSSSLPATADSSVLAYACGHRECWPDGAAVSTHAYATSKALSDHSKLAHLGDLGGNRPFRCGLAGCEKSWKSVNGLQYHLQISKYHFQQALAVRADIPPSFPVSTLVPGTRAPSDEQHACPQSQSQGTPASAPASAPAPLTSSPGAGDCPRRTAGREMPTAEAPPPPLSHSDARVPLGAGSAERDTNTAEPAPPKQQEKTKPKRKLHSCPHPGCSKQYKQLSGLRYHLTHGHLDTLPLQLEIVPPALARMVAEKGCLQG